MSLTGPQLREALNNLGLRTELNSRQMASLARSLQSINNKQKETYEDGWRASLEKFEALLQNTRDPKQILDSMDGPPKTDGLVSAFLGEEGFGIPIDPAGFERMENHIVTVRNGTYLHLPCESASDHRLTGILADLVTEDTHTIVELGSGWGRNLCHLALHLNRDDIRYVAAEQSRSGRHCAEQLLSLVPCKDSSTQAFDFYRPDFKFIERLARNDGKGALIFSRAALEQPAFIPTNFIQLIRDAAPGGTLLIQEPFGWQAETELFETALRETLYSAMYRGGKAHLEGRIFKLTDEMMNANAALWSIVCCYNMNLYDLIQRADKNGIASLERLTFNYTASNPLIPYSLAIMKLNEKAS